MSSLRPTYTYTSIVASQSGTGTHFVDQFETPLERTHLRELQQLALTRCAEAWECPRETLHVIALMAGSVDTLYYNDSIFGD